MKKTFSIFILSINLAVSLAQASFHKTTEQQPRFFWSYGAVTITESTNPTGIEIQGSKENTLYTLSLRQGSPIQTSVSPEADFSFKLKIRLLMEAESYNDEKTRDMPMPEPTATQHKTIHALIQDGKRRCRQ